MANTFSYWNNVYQKVKNEAIENSPVFFITLIFITLPLPYIFNSIAVIAFVLHSLYNFKKAVPNFQKVILLPILLYFIMVISLIWSINFKTSFQALSKELPLLLLPLCFIFQSFNAIQIKKVLSNYSYVFLGYTIFYIFKAFIRFLILKDSSLFFYHELVTLDLNAIHVSVYVSIAFFIIFIKKDKTIFDIIGLALMAVFIVLLSSKNITVIFALLLLIYALFFGRFNWKKSQLIAVFLVFSVVAAITFTTIKKRFLIEIESNTEKISLNKEEESKGLVYNVSIKDAWIKDKFSPNDYFPGTAMRVYQIRIFKEFLSEESIFFTGFGLNASWAKLKEKRIEHNLYPGYETFNFHNQYIQNFAELGIFGFVILLLMVIITLINAIKRKDFIHFSFAVLMISLFLTESFLWRQRGVVFFTLLYCLFNVKKISQSI